MHLKVFVKLKKTLKTLSSGQKKPKKTQKKTKKPKKNQKNPLGWFFFKKTWVFSNPAVNGCETLQDWPGLSVLLPKGRCLITQRLYRNCILLNLPPVNGCQTLQDWPGMSLLLPKGRCLIIQCLYRDCIVLIYLLSMDVRPSKTGQDCLSSSPRSDA
jgi:hypothetical protein